SALHRAHRCLADARRRPGREDGGAARDRAGGRAGRGHRDDRARAAGALRSAGRRRRRRAMNALVIAAQEIRVGMRNRWVLATTVLMAALALSLALLGSAPTGAVKADPLAVVVVSLASLTIFLVPLIALLLSFDAIVGEQERGTLMLLLSYPVARWQVVVGKALGQVAILAVATVVGYGAAALALWLKAEIG